MAWLPGQPLAKSLLWTRLAPVFAALAAVELKQNQFTDELSHHSRDSLPAPAPNKIHTESPFSMRKRDVPLTVFIVEGRVHGLAGV